MKTFEQLTPTQRRDMIDMAYYELVECIIKGEVDITLVNPASHKRMEKILTDTRKAEKPRLATLMFLHDKPIREELTKLAMVAASGSQYDDAGEPVTKVTKDEIDQYFFGTAQNPGTPGESKVHAQ